MPQHPYGMKVSKEQISRAIISARKLRETLPPTTCDHKGECCKAGCPNMYYCEYLAMRQGSIEKMTPQQRLDLTIDCLRRYLYPQIATKPKPCPLLSSDMLCRVYDNRPAKCRLYGLIPNDIYDKNVNDVSKSMHCQKSKMPLCCQCDRVKIRQPADLYYPDGVVPGNKIKELEQDLMSIDRELGMPIDKQDQGFGFLTFHDWHLMFELGVENKKSGEEWLSILTVLRYGLTIGLHKGLDFNPTTGIISGIPEESGVRGVLISATNDKGTGKAEISISIAEVGELGDDVVFDSRIINPTKKVLESLPDAKDVLPIITSPLTASGTVGKNFEYKITATNFPNSFDVDKENQKEQYVQKVKKAYEDSLKA